MSKKHIKIYQSHEILKGANSSTVSGYCRIFPPDRAITNSHQVLRKEREKRQMIVTI